jgi:hypothetical protein
MAQLSEWLQRERLAASMFEPRRVAAFVAAPRAADQRRDRDLPRVEWLSGTRARLLREPNARKSRETSRSDRDRV